MTQPLDIAEAVPDAGQPDDGHGSFVVTVKTPAGFGKTFRVTDHTKVETLTRKAVAQFDADGQLTSGNYRLVLMRGGTPTNLVPSSRLGDAGVVAGDQLALVTADPQVDG